MSHSFDLSKFLPYRLAVLSERISRRLAVEYERTHGLSVAEWRVLVHLQSGENLSIRDIHTRVNLEKPRVSRAVGRLQGAGLVRKMPGQGDGRLVSISLTDKGQSALGDILPVVSQIEAEWLDALSNGEREVFFKVMEKLHATLDQDPSARPRPRLD